MTKQAGKSAILRNAALVRRLPSGIRVGLALIVLPLALCLILNYWTSTQIWVPVDAPISLAKGEFKSQEFRIRVESDYSVAIDVYPSIGLESGHPVGYPPCPDRSEYCEISASWANVTWFVRRDGKVIWGGATELDRRRHKGTESSHFLGNFRATPGIYRLELTVNEDTSILNPLEPHVVIYEDQYGAVAAEQRLNYALFALVLLAPTGLATIAYTEMMRRESGPVLLGLTR